MRIVTWDELPRTTDAPRAALGLAAFSWYLERAAVNEYRRRRFATADYVGLFALEQGEVVGQTLVLRLPFRTASGPEVVSGVASVTTRFDLRRRGIGRALLTEAHRREREFGGNYALLWTNPSWFAHRLYEQLGYSDVWSSPLAVRLLPRRPPSAPGTTLRPALPTDLEPLEHLHEELTRDDVGFSPRPSGYLRAAHAAGHLDLSTLLVLRARGERLGYGVVGSGPHQLRCGEIVVGPDSDAAFLEALERRASPGLIALGNTPVAARAAALRRRGYWVRPSQEWRVLMACPLRGRRSGAGLRRELGVDRPTFTCMSLDRF